MKSYALFWGRIFFSWVLHGRVFKGTDLHLKITCLSPLRSKVRAPLDPKTLCEKVSSYLRKDGGSSSNNKTGKSFNNTKLCWYDFTHHSIQCHWAILEKKIFLKFCYMSYSENKLRPRWPCFLSDQNFFKESKRGPPKEHSCPITMKSRSILKKVF